MEQTAAYSLPLATSAARLAAPTMILRIIVAITGGSTGVSVSDQDSNSQPQQPQTLSELLVAVGIELAAEPVELLDQYRRLLWSWNERINLTRHTTLEKFVGRDVFDSFQLANLLNQKERVLDVGTGGGVPGVIMAILRPDLKVSLCESTQKKAAPWKRWLASLAWVYPFSPRGRKTSLKSARSTRW